MSFGGNDKAKTVTTQEPWSGVQPYLTQAYNQAKNIYSQGAPGYYPGQTTAPMSGYTEGALDSMFNRGLQGSPTVNAAKQMTTDTLQGNYLNSNQYLQGAINAAQQPLIQNWQNTVMPGLDSMYSSAGRYGSGAQDASHQQAASTLGQQLGNISSQMSYQNYGDERARMMQAGLMAPSLAAQDYADIGSMLQAGQGFDQFNQGMINANIDKFNYLNNAPWNYLNDYVGLLNGAVGGATTTTGTQGSSTGGIGGALGGALSGAATGAYLGSLVPGIGTAAGAGAGMLAGGAAGIFG